MILAGYGLVVARAARRRRSCAGATASSSCCCSLVGVVIAVGAHPYDEPDAARRGCSSRSRRARRPALALRSTGARGARSSCSALAGLARAAGQRRRRRRCAARASRRSLAVAVPGARRSCSSSSTSRRSSTARSTARTCSAPRTCPRTGRRRSPYARSRGDHQTRVLEMPGSDFAVVHVGQHRRPDHARAHRPAVRRARADPVRHGRHRRPAQRDRPPAPGGRRRSGRRRSRCWRRMGVGDVVAAQRHPVRALRPRAAARARAGLRARRPGLGAPKAFGRDAASR